MLRSVSDTEVFLSVIVVFGSSQKFTLSIYCEIVRWAQCLQSQEPVPSLLTHCVTLGKSLNLSGAQAPLWFLEVSEVDPGFASPGRT